MVQFKHARADEGPNRFVDLGDGVDSLRGYEAVHVVVFFFSAYQE